MPPAHAHRGHPVLVAALALAAAHSDASTIPATAPDFFEQKIRPVLVAECYECHNAKKQKGGLRLDYREGWKKGGDSGEVIVPGDAAKSLFIKAIRHDDPDLKMPSKSPKLDDAVIADFEQWVNAGAPDPRDSPPAEAAAAPTWADALAVRKSWWSLQPVQPQVPPEVKDPAWSSHPVDRFLLAKMEQHDLAPSTPADPRTFIRRLTFSLHGLPPTAEEVEAFVQESSRDGQAAVSRAAERLLASPRFGEHFARHWMDLVRYAETHGSESDPDIPQAWRYRDYLVRAFNADVPLDQLICEHLAGDLLANPRMSADGINESILGTAHLRLGEHGFQPIDTLDDQVKTVDSQIDVVSKAFQALTISCARCHDHKFDAVSQRDYYALYGVFASCRPAQVVVDTPSVQEKNRAALEALHGQIRAGLADAWTGAAGKMSTTLRAAAKASAECRVRELEEKISNIEWNARRKLTGSPAPAHGSPAPIAAWSFAVDARDEVGQLNGHLEGGAEIRNGRLILDGTGAFLRTDPVAAPVSEKTLEAWVAPANVAQRGGGVMAIETTRVHGFDGIVYGEQETGQWTSGSNNFTRTQSVRGPSEDAKPDQFVHLAIVYRADRSIAIYRNGAPYGSPYTKGELRTYEPGQAQILLGLRHTNAGNGFFAGEIEEARLYDRALSPEEVAASFRAGTPPLIAPDELTRALTQAEREQRAQWRGEIDRLRGAAARERVWSAALRDAAANPANPLHLWAKLGALPDSEFSAAWHTLAEALPATASAARRFNSEHFRIAWNLAGADDAKWFSHGTGAGAATAGEFAIERGGARIITGLAPAGVLTNRLTDKSDALVTSPRFKIESDSISVRAFGGGGAMVRLIVDNYPLGTNPIFPKAVLEKAEPGWIYLDTAYRKGNYAYLEFATRDDLTRPLADAKPGAEGRSFFGVSSVVFHDGKETPREETSGLLLLEGPPPQSALELAQRYEATIGLAVLAWREQRATEPQRALLDGLVRHGLLPATLGDLEPLRPLVMEYRRLEAEIAIPRRAPGVIETRGFDAPLLPRGDHLKPGELVPRAYLGVFGGQPFDTPQSGRLQLAGAITSPDNPLAKRVLANRVWHWLFGRGIVATVDNFGRLGDKPTHPELLDFLAAHLGEHGWSVKEMVRFLVTTRTFQMSSEASARAREADPANEWLSHFRVRRIEAEAVRDSLLAVAGKWDSTMAGPGADAGALRRSVYLAVRRTNLNPFLEVFDAPKPFGTLGRRDVTTVPAQSLALLNSPFVAARAQVWAQRVCAVAPDTAEGRVRRMFVEAFARLPDDAELRSSLAYLDQLRAAPGVPPDRLLTAEPVWQGFAHALFNSKEFIYLR